MKSSNGAKPVHSGGSVHDEFNPGGLSVSEDLDLRIDWDRKQRNKRDVRDEEADDFIAAEEHLSIVLDEGERKSGRQRKKKQRHMIYDDEDDRVVILRKRKRQRYRHDDEW